MSFSPLADMSREIDCDRWNYRGNYTVQGVILHHNAGVDAWGAATDPSRNVSANYWIANDGTIIPNIDEEYRAWTTADEYYPDSWTVDYSAITFEISNSPEGWATRTWAISDAAYESVCKLIGDIFKRYDLGPVYRGINKGVQFHDDYVVTVCPGPYITEHIDDIIAKAEAYRTGDTPAPEPTPEILEEDEDMKPTVHVRTEGGFEATLGWHEIGLELEPGEVKQIGSKLWIRLGMYVTTDEEIAKAWARIWCKGQGSETSRTDRDGYVDIQKQLEMFADELRKKTKVEYCDLTD